jgi:hypothetical protein
VDPYILVFNEEGLDQLGLVAAEVVADDVNLAALRLSVENFAEEADGGVMPRTSPVAVFRAANRLKVPLRLYSNPWLSAYVRFVSEAAMPAILLPPRALVASW